MARRPTRPRPAPAEKIATAVPQKAVRPIGVQILFWMTIACLAALTFGLTPFTYNLDDIKVSILFCLFPLPLIAYFVLLARGDVPSPPRLLNIALGAYVIVLLVSSFRAEYKWIAIYLTGFTLAALGAYFGAVGVVRNRADLERLTFALLVICAGTIIFGMLHRLKLFDVMNQYFYEGKAPSYKLSPTGQLVTSAFHSLLYTLAGADREMMSTVLNRDFFAAYLNMTIPLALGLAVSTGSTLLRRFCLATFATGLLCILLTMSKNDYVIMVITPLLFLALYFRYVRSQEIRIPNLHVWVIGTLIVFATIVFLRWNLFSDKLKLFHADQLTRNLSSRWIIWHGALMMFKDFPLLGAGPGSFRVLFPLYRHPDYFMNDISTLTLSSHNAYLDYLAETGLLGFLAMISFLGMMAFMLLRHIITHPDRRVRALLSGIFCGYAGILLANLTSPFSRWAIGATIYGFLGTVAAGINAARLPVESTTKPPIGRTRRWTCYALAACAVALLCHHVPYGIRYFKASVENNTGLLYLNSSEPELLREGAVHFEKAAELNPTFVTSYYRLASLYHSLSRIEEANREAWLKKSEDTYKKLSKLAPDYSEIHYNFGILYGDMAEIASAKAQATSDTSQKQVYLLEERNYLSRAAEEHAAAARQSNKLATQMAAAAAYEALADAKQAEAQAALLSVRDALEEQIDGLLQRAEAIYSKILTYDPKRSDVVAPYPEGDPGLLYTRLNLGLLLERRGKIRESVEVLREFLQSSPGDVAATEALARILQQSKDEPLTESILDEMVNANPLDVEYRLRRMQFYQEHQRNDDALREAQQILKIEPKNAKALKQVEDAEDGSEVR